MIARLKELMPAPMAAPETPQLRGARLRIIGCLMVVAVIVAAWTPLHALLGLPVLALLAGALGMLGVQVPIYLAIKAHADDVWLTECLEANRAKEAANDA